MAHPIVEALVELESHGTPHPVAVGLRKCDYECCPGRRASASKRLIWHPKYLFVHAGCVAGARAAARSRSEAFGFRFGL